MRIFSPRDQNVSPSTTQFTWRSALQNENAADDKSAVGVLTAVTSPESYQRLRRQVSLPQQRPWRRGSRSGFCAGGTVPTGATCQRCRSFLLSDCHGFLNGTTFDFVTLGPLLFASRKAIFRRCASVGAQSVPPPLRATMLRLLRLRSLPPSHDENSRNPALSVVAHADFSDTLHCSGSALLAALRAGSIREGLDVFASL